MLALLAPLLSGVFSGAFSSLIDGYKAKLAAENTTDKLAVDLAAKEIEAEIAARAEATKIMTLENGRWFTWMPRAIVQWSFALFVAKVVVYDKVFALGSTDPLNGDVGAWAGMVMVTWFGGRSLEKIAQVFGRK
jgi:hypothetical protein